MAVEGFERSEAATHAVSASAVAGIAGPPNVTDVKYRAQYKLYAGKPCLDENASLCRGCLQRRIESIGETVLWGVSGDSAHFFARQDAANMVKSSTRAP